MSTTMINSIKRRFASNRMGTGKSLIGIDITDSEMRFARYPFTSDSGWLTGKLRVEEQILDGSPRSGRLIAGELRKLGFQPGPAFGSLLSTELEVFPLIITHKKHLSLESQIISLAGDNLSYPISQAVIDYVEIPSDVRRPGESTTPVLVYAAPLSLTTNIAQSLDSAGLPMSSLMTPACSLTRPINDLYPNERHVVIMSSQMATSVSIMQNGHVLLERFLSWSLKDLFSRLRDELDLSHAQCEMLLAGDFRTSQPEVSNEDEPESGPGLDNSINEILATNLQELAHEAAQCISFCNSQLVSHVVSRVLLCGLIAEQNIISDFLSNNLSLPCEQFIPATPASNSGNVSEIDHEYALAASNALWNTGDQQTHD